jgi:WD40 repeat protein
VRQYKLKKCKRVHGIHFTPDGTRLLAVGGEEVRMVDCAVWLDLATGENVDRIEQFANCYAVDPALTRYALGGADNWEGIAAVQWRGPTEDADWETFPEPPGRKRAPKFREVSGLAFDPTGGRLAISHFSRQQSRELSLVPLEGEERIDIETDEAWSEIAFSADAALLAVAGGVDGSRYADVYDIASRTKRSEFLPPGTVTRCVQFLPDNRLVVANGRNVYVLSASFKSGRAGSFQRGGWDPPQFTLAGHPKQVNAVALTPDGRRILTASHDGSIKTWDANTGEPGPAFDWGIGPVTAVCFAPDGLTCAAAGLNGKVVVWDVDG